MIPTLIRRTAALNWAAASAFVAANDGLDDTALGAIAVMAVFVALAFLAASLLASGLRALALTTATVLVIACLGVLSVGVLMLPTGVAAFGAIAALIVRAASRRRGAPA